MKRFHILDWAGNVKFNGRDFSSFDDAEDFLSDFLGEAYENDRQEYTIDLVGDNDV